MESIIQRTIEKVLDIQTGSLISSDEFFSRPENEIFKIRYHLEEHIKNNTKYLVCPYCQQQLKIRGTLQGKNVLHFAHLRDSDDCPIKTDQDYTQEEILRMQYNGVKESDAHRNMKALIVRSLQADTHFSDIKQEETFKHTQGLKEWRRPDVSAKIDGHDIVFEIQLSTTFLSILVDRDSFYKQNHTFIGWIFSEFTADVTQQRFFEKDILHSNNSNAFVINNKTCHHSEVEGKFYLLCYYLEPVIQHNQIITSLQCQEVCFHDLTIDYNTYKFYYFDFEKEQQIKVAELQENKRRQEESKKRPYHEQKPISEPVRKAEKREEKISPIIEQIETLPTIINTLEPRKIATQEIPYYFHPLSVFPCRLCHENFTLENWVILYTIDDTCICRECLPLLRKRGM